jgi:hypothetical protein
MIPTIEDIVAGLIAGTYTREQAIAWLYQHKELSAELAAEAAAALERGVWVPREPINGERFVRAWLQLDKLPGGMGMSSSGKVGPIPATSSCLVTTSKTTLAEWERRSVPFIEIWLAAAPVSYDEKLDVLAGRSDE